jgi:hypothetical protein
MATPLADALFWFAALAILVAQVVILRSTKRGMAVAGPVRSPVLEWIFAVGPAIGLIVLLYGTRLAMHPTELQGAGVAPKANATLIPGPRA